MKNGGSSQWGNDPCPMCQNNFLPETATHIFICPKSKQREIKYAATQVCIGKLHYLMDLGISIDTLIDCIFQLPSCPTSYGQSMPTSSRLRVHHNMGFSELSMEKAGDRGSYPCQPKM